MIKIKFDTIFGDFMLKCAL